MALSEYGLPFYGSAEELLAATFSLYFDPGQDVSMVLVSGETAELSVRVTPDRSATMEMVLEDGHWRFDLRDAYRDSIHADFAGSYMPGGVLSTPPERGKDR